MENRKRFGVKQDSFQQKSRFHKPAPKQNPDDFVFGVQSVLEVLNSEKDVEKILIQKGFSHDEVETLAREKNIGIQRVPVERLNKVTGKNHQGVIAYVSAINYASLSNVIASAFETGRTPIVLLLDRITDVRNFGAIARTSEASAVNAIIIPTKGAAQINSDAMKTSSGALTHIPVCRVNELTAAVQELQDSGFTVIGCTEKTKDTYFRHDLTGPLAIVMGSEEDGISDELIEKCDMLGKIPMLGKVGSLNVSVACGVLLYETNRQRMSSAE
ncbi:23S rRNA (guanosine(2251)-2'-O)-methyltransferase RlmB [Arcticibacterium luteifluviistationis]|uniref:23S rRNA (Guanosine(2251)-2'-O)-methyltransferase RlmB n=1 Tax=Arcticibacterium luteifluviistationis TaxID=1784714 RepID=A0A2Z4GHY4_9BACT|nr:23S rRNA (guanosine(2251)-2'-O)-methyltransferase RlmB [Arcticibacterium luteifluviistationis]AWW00576.1 23S rRNA (guanosine(2251)-2'-O)-methyltransferase RlmB [Arcticibacterium luteifluviistationis]